MIFRDWLKELDYTLLQGSVDVETEDVIYDSRKAAPGKVFVAMKGIRVDGHSFIPQVLKAGVRVLVTERPVEEELKNSIAYQALAQISAIYKLDESWKGRSCEYRTEHRRRILKPLVDEYFDWVKEQVKTCSVPPKSETGEGLSYSIHQEKYLRTFLEDGNIPIDNSACERAIRPFCVGRKNWNVIDTVEGAQASAIAYSIAETAKANHLKPYQYFEYLLTELPKRVTQKKDSSFSLDDLMPWSSELPMSCRKIK